MKKILVSLSMIAVVAAVVVGATTAYFTSQKTIAGNTFTAGTLELAADYNGIWGAGTGTPVITESNMYPGFVGTTKYAAVANTGSLPLNWAFTLNKTSETPGPVGGGALSTVLKVKIEAVMEGAALKQYPYEDGFNCQNTSLPWVVIYGANAGTQTVVGSTVIDENGFVAAGTYPDPMGQIAPGKGVCVRFTTYLDGNLVALSGGIAVETPDNAYQGASVIYEMVADATQIIISD